MSRTTGVPRSAAASFGQGTLAGSGLVFAGGDLDVKIDDSTVEINADTLRVKDLGITNAKLAGGITSAKLANGAGLASAIAAGLGASAAYNKASNGVLANLLAADPANARAVLIIVTVDETFANGDMAQTTFKIGETDTDNKFAATTKFTDKAAGSVLVFAGTLTANKALFATATAATGTGTGGISVSVLALNEA